MTDLHIALDRGAGHLAAQLTQGLRDGVRSGRLAAGTRLPSSRALAADLATSRGVVVEAYEQLVAEGYLTARHGSGTAVAATPAAAPASAPGTAPDPHAVPLLDLNPGTPDLAAFPRRLWLAATRHALATAPHSALGYPDASGAPALLDALAGHLGRVRAARATPATTVIVGGVAQGLALVAQALARRGRTALAVEDPSSERQHGLFANQGVRLVPVPVDAEGVDVDALARTGVRAVLVTPAHQFPTGVVLSPRRRAALIAWARDVGGLVVEDDYDAEFRYDRDPVGSLQGLAPDVVAHLGSTSKALAPALRLGWAVLPGQLADEVRELKRHQDLGAPTLPQLALAHLLTTGAYDRHLRTLRTRYRARRDALVDALAEHLPDARVHGIAAGMHVYVELPPGGPREAAVVERAARRGLRIAPVAPMRAADGPPAVVLGYATLGADRLGRAAAVLAAACAAR